MEPNFESVLFKKAARFANLHPGEENPAMDEYKRRVCEEMRREKEGCHDVEIGDFITVKEWDIFGMVVRVEQSELGPEDCLVVTLKTDPDEEETELFWLRPGEYENHTQ